MAFLTKRAIPRRALLRGMGAAVALPLLDAMVPSATVLAQTVAVPRRRFGAVFIPNGAIVEQWTPTAAGVGFELSPILKPIERFKQSLVVVSNLTRANPGVVEGDHAISAAGWLTGIYPKRTEAEDVLAGTTIDQAVAARIGQDTPFPSLEIATTDFTGYVGACTSGFSCAYTNTISWSTPTTPLPMEINPRVVFERLFGRPGTEAERAARRRRDRSILDLIGEQAADLRRQLGAADRVRVGDYLDNLREIERRIQRAEARTAAEVPSITLPIGIPDSFEEHLALMYELLTVAYQADLTRVFTFMTDRELSQRTYPELNIPQTHHDASHHGGNTDNMERHAKINVHYAQLFAAFLEKLRSMPEGDGTVLDHSLIFYGAGMSDGQAHAPYPLPLIAVGRGGGTVKGDRHIIAGEWTPIANLWLGVSELYGERLDSFAESNGRVEL